MDGWCGGGGIVIEVSGNGWVLWWRNNCEYFNFLSIRSVQVLVLGLDGPVPWNALNTERVSS